MTEKETTDGETVQPADVAQAARRAHEVLAAAPPEGLPIRRLIPLVKATIGTVGKNRRMEEGRQKYLYRSVDDMLDAAHLGLVAAGVFPVPTAYTHVGADGTERPGLLYTDFSSASGTKGVRITGTITYTLMGPLDELAGIPIIVEANDYADKGTAKTYALGIKLLMSQLFLIPYGLPDQDDESPERMADQPARSGGGGGQRRQGGQRPAQSDGREQAAALVTEAKRKNLEKAAQALSPEGQRLLRQWRTAEGIDVTAGKFLVTDWRRMMQKAAELAKEHKAEPGEEGRAATAERLEGAEETAGAPERPGQMTDPYADEDDGADLERAELRDHFAARVERLGVTFWEAFAQLLGDAEGNPMPEADWRIQMRDLPPEWDDFLAEAVASTEAAHVQQNPPEYSEEEEPF